MAPAPPVTRCSVIYHYRALSWLRAALEGPVHAAADYRRLPSGGHRPPDGPTRWGDERRSPTARSHAPRGRIAARRRWAAPPAGAEPLLVRPASRRYVHSARGFLLLPAADKLSHRQPRRQPHRMAYHSRSLKIGRA